MLSGLTVAHLRKLAGAAAVKTRGTKVELVARLAGAVLTERAAVMLQEWGQTVAASGGGAPSTSPKAATRAKAPAIPRGRAKAPARPPPDLPPEIILEIVGWLWTDPPSVARFALTSRRWLGLLSAKYDMSWLAALHRDFKLLMPYALLGEFQLLNSSESPTWYAAYCELKTQRRKPLEAVAELGKTGAYESIYQLYLVALAKCKRKAPLVFEVDRALRVANAPEIVALHDGAVDRAATLSNLACENLMKRSLKQAEAPLEIMLGDGPLSMDRRLLARKLLRKARLLERVIPRISLSPELMARLLGMAILHRHYAAADRLEPHVPDELFALDVRTYRTSQLRHVIRYERSRRFAPTIAKVAARKAAWDVCAWALPHMQRPPVQDLIKLFGAVACHDEPEIGPTRLAILGQLAAWWNELPAG